MKTSAMSRYLSLAVILASFAFLSVSHAEEQHVCRFCAEHQSQLFGVELEGDGRRYAPIRHVDIQHIRLDVTPNFKQQTITVKTLIRFSPLRKPLAQLELNAVDLTIDTVVGSSEIEEFSSTKKDLTIKFAKPLPVGQEAWVEISHRCQPTGGFYFRTKEMGYDEKDTHCWTQGESHYARQWFPCFDYPNEKSTTEVICRVPEKMTVLSNGKLLSETVDNKTGLKTVHWLQDKPHVNYLICIVAGYLEKLESKHRDIPLAYYTQPSLIKHAANSFQDTKQIMAFFEDEIGVQYPWHKYYQVTIRDFMAGGMENTTLTTLTHRTIFSKATENIRSSRGLDAHEMAHQWFGDLVTCKDWSHLWLNEGFATYYTHLYEGHKFGNDAKLYGLYRDASGRILTSGNDKKPIVWKDYSNAGEQFDYRAYPKGSWVLHMLRSQLGEDLYRKCIKTYLQKHQLTSVVTEDLNKTLEQVSGRSFDQFFDQWVYHARHPDFKVTYKWLPNEKLAKVTVSQTHKVDNDVLLFSVPVTLRFRIGEKYVDHEVLVNAKAHEFFIPLTGKPDIVRFDPEYTILANVTFEKPDEMLVAQLSDTNDMIGRIRAVQGLAKRKNHVAIENIQKALNNDSFFGVRIEASKALGKIRNKETYTALVASLQQSNAKVRQQVVKDLGGFYRDDQRLLLHKIIAEEKNPAIVADAVKALAKYADEASYKIIAKVLATPSFNNDLANAAISALKAQNNPQHAWLLGDTIVKRKMEFSDRSFATLLEAFATLSSQTKDTQQARLLLIEQLGDTRERVRVAAVKSLGILGDKEATALLQSYVTEDTTSKTSKEATAALQKLSEQKPLAPKEIVELRKLINDLKNQNDRLEKSMTELKKKVEAKK
ncbi:MAG: hypothetical protein COA78_30890 [Blastopirellula sp.]|nr:MAG: hypothetical protein COA78_30890 [Blastopirellula sp.]